MKGWCIHNEHAETSASKNAQEIVLVPDNVPAEWEGEFGFDGEDVEALGNEY